MTLLDKEPVKRVMGKLKEFDAKLEVMVLNSSAKTASEAASSLGCEVGAIIKSLLFKTENTFTLCLISGDKKASLNKIKSKLNIKDVSIQLMKLKKLIYYRGVSPIGHLSQIAVLTDNSFERFNDLFAAAGHPNCVFKISLKDLKI